MQPADAVFLHIYHERRTITLSRHWNKHTFQRDGQIIQHCWYLSTMDHGESQPPNLLLLCDDNHLRIRRTENLDCNTDQAVFDLEDPQFFEKLDDFLDAWDSYQLPPAPQRPFYRNKSFIANIMLIVALIAMFINLGGLFINLFLQWR
jgi:hypothetical protein